MSLLPPAGIAAALGATFIPVLVLFLGGRIVAFRAPGLRYKVSVAAAAAAWATGIGLFALAGAHIGGIDVLAGFAVIVAAAILVFIAWSLVAWGLTVNMLLTLAGAGRPIELERWASFFSGGRGIADITADRAAVLLATGLVRTTELGYAITLTGRVTAGMVTLFKRLFGLVR